VTIFKLFPEGQRERREEGKSGKGISGGFQHIPPTWGLEP